MNDDELRCFVAVADLLSFSRAADQLYITQPAATQRILSLEKEFGFPLFVRSTRSVVLTEQGRACLPQVRRYLAELDSLFSEVAAIRSQPVTEVRFGYITDGHAAIMQRMIQLLSERRAGVHITPVHLRPDQMLSAAAEGEVDAALHCLFSAKDHGGVRFYPLDRPGFSAKMVRTHPLASQKSLTIRDLAGENVLLYPRVHDPLVHDYITSHIEGLQYISVDGILEVDVALNCQRAVSLASACPVETPGFRLVPVRELASPLGVCLITAKEKMSPEREDLIRLLVRCCHS